MRTNTLKTAIILTVLAVAALPAQATLITIQIEAVVDSVEDDDNYLEGQINPGDIITGYYTYESTTSDTNPSVYVGDYEHYISPCGIFLSVGGFEFETDLTNVDFVLEVVNDYPSGDSYLVRSYNNLPLTNGTLVDHISWQLDDSTGTALSSDALPITPPILEDWSGNDLRLDGERGAYMVRGHVTSAIPEPTTFVLFGSSGFLLART